MAVPDGVTVELTENRAVFLPEMPTAGRIFNPGVQLDWTAERSLEFMEE